MTPDETTTLRARVEMHEFLLALLVTLNAYQILPRDPSPGPIILFIGFGMLTGLLFARMLLSLYGGRLKRSVRSADTEETN